MKGHHAMNDQSYPAAHDIPIGAHTASRRPEADSTRIVDEKRFDVIIHSQTTVGYDFAGG
jgi:hypothetical protein